LVTRHSSFHLEDLRRFARLVALMTVATWPLRPQVTMQRSDRQTIAVTINGRPFTEFVFGNQTPKPNLEPLRSANGLVVTRRFPRLNIPGETTDHPEHRGVWFGHSDVNGLNFYANENSYTNIPHGSIVLQSIDRLTSGQKSGSIEATLAWRDAAGNTLLVERRRMVFYAEAVNRVIDFDFQITATTQVHFGDHRDGAFSLRLADGLQAPGPKLPGDPPRTGEMTSAAGCHQESECWGKPAEWMDVSGKIDGQGVGVAIFDHPQNSGHPVRWQARGYGLFAANPFGLREYLHDPLADGGRTLAPGQTLRLRYRVLIHPGNAAEAKVAKEYERYAHGTGRLR
jgi:hypothetical protein